MRIIDWIAGLFRKEEKEEAVLCRCDDHPFGSMMHFDNLALTSGHWTAFFLAKCAQCGGYDGFPRMNFYLALQEGTEETLKYLRDAGVEVEKARLVLRYNLEDLC